MGETEREGYIFCPVVQNRSPLAGIVPLARNSGDL